MHGATHTVGRQTVEWLAAQGPAHLQCIGQAMRDAGLALIPLGPGQRLQRDALPADRPRLVLITEDYGQRAAPGPAGYSEPTLRAAFAPAASVVIHAGCPSSGAYVGAVSTALICRHAVLIETQAHRVAAWLAAIGTHAPGAATLVVAPGGGS